MTEDPQQTRRLLLTRIVKHLSAQQVDLCDQLRTVRSELSPHATGTSSGWRLSTAPAPPTAFCIPARLVERPLRHPTRRNYNYFTELDLRLSELAAGVSTPSGRGVRAPVPTDRSDRGRSDSDHDEVAAVDRRSG
jgi:hypothetical protein